jgi:long-chain acyl-CoA synthetase
MRAALKKLFGYKTEKERFDEYYQSILIDGKMMFVGLLLQRAAQHFPHNIALICQDVFVTYNELYRKTIAVSKQLIEMDVKPGDRVALLFENSIEFYLGYYGIWQAGAVVIPLNTFLHEKELYQIIENAQPKVMIISHKFAERLTELDGNKLPPFIHEKELISLANNAVDDPNYKIPCLPSDSVAAILYTSGTTGFPKGVMLSSKNILTNVIQGVCRTYASPNDRVLAALPLFHSFAQTSFVWSTFFLGGTSIVVPRIDRKFLFEGLKHNPTVIAGVPALYGLFCLMRTVPFDHVRYFFCGGDALPDKIRIGFELIYRRRLCNGYGLTEASPLIAVNFDDELLAPNTVGKVSIGIKCSLRDEDGIEVKPGKKGILWVKGDNIMMGYYNAPDLTNKDLKDGWLDTGDLAYFDEKNRLVIAGRHKDLIKNKGIKIYPAEIENILIMHPAVINAAVLGKKDPDVGEYPVAFVELSHDVPNIEQELRKLCKENLASYKIPHKFYILGPGKMPMTSLRKVDKKRLRKEFLGQENS